MYNESYKLNLCVTEQCFIRIPLNIVYDTTKI